MHYYVKSSLLDVFRKAKQAACVIVILTSGCAVENIDRIKKANASRKEKIEQRFQHESKAVLEETIEALNSFERQITILTISLEPALGNAEILRNDCDHKLKSTYFRLNSIVLKINESKKLLETVSTLELSRVTCKKELIETAVARIGTVRFSQADITRAFNTAIELGLELSIEIEAEIGAATNLWKEIINYLPQLKRLEHL